MDIFEILRTHPLHAALAVLLVGIYSYTRTLSLNQRAEIAAAGVRIIDAFQPELHFAAQYRQGLQNYSE
jgi:hypothetical protein